MTRLHPDVADVSSPADSPAETVADAIESDLLLVEHEFSAFLAARRAEAAGYGDGYVRLWQSVTESARGGKRLRPRLVLTAYHGLNGGGNRSDAVQTALAFELLHTAFLLHDDVIDGDTVRRGRPNVAGEFSADALFRGADEPRARLWGQSAAILAGDLLLHAATQRVARLTTPEPSRSLILDLFERAVFVTAAGELADVGLAAGLSDGRIDDVLAMTEEKTAEYTVAAPLAAGAALARADPELRDLLAGYGRLVGTAFQLGDDLLGVFGEEAVTGKSASSDLRQGKQTSLIAFARGTREWPAIQPLLGHPDLSAAEAAAAGAALERCGARAFVNSLIATHVAAAIATLDSPLVPADLAATLARLAHSCVGRTS
ncbi:polyprenyl synthetase family protein [Leifsonia shinshuensis]|uniref:polyprenyl synthetase family protein n=1 Tax=Leifsonia shinshuensis TaxID=150026 RepID=UPI001F5094F5|nr:polyprenyl synthetase family protein [Leifsonia shinshuensis]MCI0155907.1 polyprenyl synthetase family protein [Leifsonia shinshuensis]